MNVAGAGDGAKQSPSFASADKSAQDGAAAPAVPSIVPGAVGGGSNVFGAGGSAPSQGRVSAGAPSYYQKSANPNVLNGERSGAGGTPPPGDPLAAEKNQRGLAGMPGFPGFGRPDDMARMRGLDLKRYLPGGDRFVAGRMSGSSSRRGQLLGPNENFFQVVSARYQIHCRLQLLAGCADGASRLLSRIPRR